MTKLTTSKPEAANAQSNITNYDPLHGPYPVNDAEIHRTQTSEQIMYNLGHTGKHKMSGLFVIPADDPRILDSHGQIDVQKAYFTDLETGRLLTDPDEIEQHFAQGYISNWPELHDPRRQAAKNLITLTTSEDKKYELWQPVKFFKTVFKTINQFLGYTPEESKEAEVSSSQIVLGKTATFQEALADATRSQREEIASANGIDDFSEVATVSNDVTLEFDPILKTASVWDRLKENEDPLVREVFANMEDGSLGNHGFPGKRTREITKAVGGAINFYRLMKEAMAELDAKGTAYSKDITTTFANHYAPVNKGDANKTNLPDAGVITYQTVNGLGFLDVPEEQLQKMEADQSEFTMEHVQVLTDMGTKENPMTTAGAREDHPEFFADTHPTGQAFNAIASLTGMEKLPEPQNRNMVGRPDDANILVVGGSEKDLAELKQKLEAQDPGKTVSIDHISEENFKNIKDTGELERRVNRSDAIVVPDQSYDHLTDEDALALKSVREYVVAYRLALEGKGSNPTSGCPLFVTQDAYEEVRYHGDFFNKGSTATKVDKVIRFYEGSLDSLVSGLSDKNWIPEDYKDHKQRTPKKGGKKGQYKFLTEADLLEKIGVDNMDDLGPVVAVLGGATTEEITAVKDAENFAYEAAKAGITVTHGGGTSGVMGAFMKGAIRAHLEGYRNFKQIGFRTPVVSNAEGSIKKFVRTLVKEINDEHGTSYTVDDIVKGDIESDNFSLFDDHIHMIDDPDFVVRQDSILKFAQYQLAFSGASGTASEIVEGNLNSAFIDATGHGVRVGSDIANRQKVKQFIVNTPLEIQGKITNYFQAVVDSKTDEERKRLDQNIVEFGSEALAQIEQDIAIKGIKRRYVVHTQGVAANDVYHALDAHIA